MKRHSKFQTIDMSKESKEQTASQWMLFCLSGPLCISLVTRGNQVEEMGANRGVGSETIPRPASTVLTLAAPSRT